MCIIVIAINVFKLSMDKTVNFNSGKIPIYMFAFIIIRIQKKKLSLSY